jgi:hypothetical protein
MITVKGNLMEKLIQKFDQYIASRISIILNWLWKSGLLLFLIGLLLQNINIQNINSTKIIDNSSAIKALLIDISYLRRDIDLNLFSSNNKKVLKENG